MPETKKIRLTKGLPWTKAGTEIEVFDYNGAEAIHIHPKNGTYVFYLSELEGWYEVVRYKPNPGQFYFFVSDTGASVKDRYTAPFERHDRLIESGNCEETREKSTSKAEQIRAIFKEGV